MKMYLQKGAKQAGRYYDREKRKDRRLIAQSIFRAVSKRGNSNKKRVSFYQSKAFGQCNRS